MMFGMIMINRELKEIRVGWVVIKERGPLVSGGSCRSHMGGPCSSSKRMRPDCTVTRHTITNIQIQKYKYTWSSQSQGWSLLLQGDGTQLHSKTTTTLMQKFPHCPAATLHPPTHPHPLGTRLHTPLTIMTNTIPHDYRSTIVVIFYFCPVNIFIETGLPCSSWIFLRASGVSLL